MTRSCAANKTALPGRTCAQKPGSRNLALKSLAEKAKPPAGKVTGGHARYSQHREAEDGDRLPAAGRSKLNHKNAAGTCAAQHSWRSTARYQRDRLPHLSSAAAPAGAPHKFQINAAGQLRRCVRGGCLKGRLQHENNGLTAGSALWSAAITAGHVRPDMFDPTRRPGMRGRTQAKRVLAVLNTDKMGAAFAATKLSAVHLLAQLSAEERDDLQAGFSRPRTAI